ncbi:MAG: TIGR04283 family arsenosugar biosynthesis glycosyltransferase [Acidobacteriota bacterium]|nr:TIGR04283 family arsenosugar biosynthesis glycosyltransferase [Acidobacteriota bacterium]
MNPEISIIIPTLNEEDSIRETLRALENFAAENIEIIVVDGGSDDSTLAIAQDFPVTILHSNANRGEQMRIGGAWASGKILWFLHADTLPAPVCVGQIKRALDDKFIVGGNFTIRFGGKSTAANFMTWLYPKLQHLGLVYGDSAIFVRREIYEKIGGFKNLPLFEDIDLVERLRREGKLITLCGVVKTSSRRFEKRSFFLTFLRWTIFQVLYWFGVNPRQLAGYYYHIRR